MAGELSAIGACVAAADFGRASEDDRRVLERGMRASLLCALLGVEREPWVWPYPARGRGSSASAVEKMLAGLFEPFDGIGHLATLAGAADLDPMDPGPSHTVLPATLASCVAASLSSSQRSADAREAASRSGVLAGVEAAWRIRRSVTGTRPGVGFHSAGVFGTIAAAAAAARTLGLDEPACANAVAIALTRAAGLAVNSAASMIGLTHFGWGAVHGLEAALLASEGWRASQDVDRALSSLFGEGRIDLSELTTPPASTAASALVFKRYPCNIYLNLVVMLLEPLAGRRLDRIEISMPWIPHLDCPRPGDLRQARNSAQAVAAIAGAGDTSYAAFSGPPGPWMPSGEVSRLLGRVELVADRSAPTRLNEAVIGVRAWSDSALVLDASQAVRSMGHWGVEHARKLVGSDDRTGGVDALYGGSVLAGFDHLSARRRLATEQTT